MGRGETEKIIADWLDNREERREENGMGMTLGGGVEGEKQKG